MWSIFNLWWFLYFMVICILAEVAVAEAQYQQYGLIPQQHQPKFQVIRAVNVQLPPLAQQNSYLPPNNYLPPAPAPISTKYGPPPPVNNEDELKKLFRLICSTFKKMSDFALADNYEIGCRIEKILRWEAEKAGKILYDARKSSKRQDLRRRYKRQATCSASTPMNNMGQILVDSNSNIGTEKKRLKRDTQKNINNEYKNGVSACAADSCKAASKILDSVDESERQR